MLMCYKCQDLIAFIVLEELMNVYRAPNKYEIYSQHLFYWWSGGVGMVAILISVMCNSLWGLITTARKIAVENAEDS